MVDFANPAMVDALLLRHWSRLDCLALPWISPSTRRWRCANSYLWLRRWLRRPKSDAHTLLQMWQHGPLGVVTAAACLRVRRSSAAWLDSIMNTFRPALWVSRHVDHDGPTGLLSWPVITSLVWRNESHLDKKTRMLLERTWRIIPGYETAGRHWLRWADRILPRELSTPLSGFNFRTTPPALSPDNPRNISQGYWMLLLQYTLVVLIQHYLRAMHYKTWQKRVVKRFFTGI